MQMLTAVVVLATAVCMCNCQRVNFAFPVESRLTCMAQNPHAGLPGQPYEVPADIPKIPPQPGAHGEVPLPVQSPYIPHFH